MHRDLKPANILIDDNCSIKICDYGLSRGIIKQKKPKYTVKYSQPDMIKLSKITNDLLNKKNNQIAIKIQEKL